MSLMNTMSTSQGEVKLFRPPTELLDSIEALFPLGLARYIPPQQGADHGLVIKRGESELFAVKQQPVDCDEKQSKITYQANAILIADSLSRYLAHGFSGLFLPCTYIRTKNSGRFESGIAYFGAPSQEGPECRKNPYNEAYDGEFGHGFTTMMTAFIHALQKSSHDTGITLSTAIGLEVRTWLQLGSFSLGYMLFGPHVICLKTVVSEHDPTWTILRSKGIDEVVYIPTLAAILKASAGSN